MYIKCTFNVQITCDEMYMQCTYNVFKTCGLLVGAVYEPAAVKLSEGLQKCTVSLP